MAYRESFQHKLDRIRPPRVQITYDVEIGDAVEQKELPLVVGVLSDLAGQRQGLPRMRERKFVEIDRDNFDKVMASIGPELKLSVADKLQGGDAKMNVELRFPRIDAFLPHQVVQDVEPLRALLEARGRMVDLLAKLDGNDALVEKLKAVLADEASVQKLEAELKADPAPAEDPAAPGVLAGILQEGKLARDEAQATRARELVKEFVEQARALQATPQMDLVSLIGQAITRVDTRMGEQLDEVLHAPAFQKLEASWRGLHLLVSSSETGTNLKLRVMHATMKELLDDMERAPEFDQSVLFKKVYEEEYGTFGGQPYGVLIGDYEFGRGPRDLALLESISHVAAAAHAPFIAAASPQLFDLDSFAQIGAPRDLARLFESTELIRWRGFRESEDSRYTALVLPHILLRLPYGPDTVPVEGFQYQEDVDGSDHHKYLWGNAAYALGQRITDAFSLYQWCANIRGMEGGGVVSDLPTHTFRTDEGDIAQKCPTEIAITDRREKELSDLGFITLCHCKGTDYAAFFGSQTVNRPRRYDTPQATANAELSSQLPYLMAASRFAHYLKVIMRDKIGGFTSRQEISNFLNRWIEQYVQLNDEASFAIKARQPLREARVEVTEEPSRPGAYRAVVFLRPHFQLTELTASIRLVSKLPAAAN
ncbi:type VI secretion system contractile sheath large subunit [Melittangium boletus]|uniref:EvpB family type VI secretion protein n=1 Tax=Melittangium boletus DSM 14713 TaxID=1294270 RepID=A0A250IAY8_9BACT|nr:type VI secretion system contractile sheath large subunit [Melittangium boletus]ATB28915.1 EvpB family type VI secretion protein [Melittangium boletus DSM 14713]